MVKYKYVDTNRVHGTKDQKRFQDGYTLSKVYKLVLIDTNKYNKVKN